MSLNDLIYFDELVDLFDNCYKFVEDDLLEYDLYNPYGYNDVHINIGNFVGTSWISDNYWVREIFGDDLISCLEHMDHIIYENVY